ncbi:hypothetical protein [Brevibacillus brevis]|uniref:Uncharacterized protein n=1 Tax=Brevibacillus brevis TaxID=1393 RepID=A0ABY9TAF2_BREBE|nr:hypothetical protein [Brevibacillus brevis]WNC17086.1 hypothetical protein RGB73_12505 [Brevibacillus brevis]
MLARFYQQFEETLLQEGTITASRWGTYAGQRFFYVSSAFPASALTKRLTETGERLAAGTILKPECIYVRSDDREHVYRFRFTVPNEKQFCCGNLCEDCFLLRERKSAGG